MIRPRLQYMLVNSAAGLGMRVFRPFAFVSGRF